MTQLNCKFEISNLKKDTREEFKYTYSIKYQSLVQFILLSSFFLNCEPFHHESSISELKYKKYMEIFM